MPERPHPDEPERLEQEMEAALADLDALAGGAVPIPGTREWIRLGRDGLCQRCGKRAGSIRWGDALAMTHGGGELRCGRCVYGPQLRHALGRVVAIPGLLAHFVWALMKERRVTEQENTP